MTRPSWLLYVDGKCVGDFEEIQDALRYARLIYPNRTETALKQSPLPAPRQRVPGAHATRED